MVQPTAAEKPLLISVNRPVYDQYNFDENYGIVSTKSDVRRSVRSKVKKYCTCSKDRAKEATLGFFPIIDCMLHYRWKEDILSDIIAGITVGIMNIPQGMAYGILTGLPPLYGLYTSLFPPLIYAIFGTSKQASVGTFAIISLMVQTALQKSLKAINAHSSNCSDSGGNEFGSEIWSTAPSTLMPDGNQPCNFVPEQVAISVTLTFLTGLFMILFGILRLGFISSYMSDQLVQGLTTAAAVHVMTSQVKPLLGLHFQSDNNDFVLGPFYYQLFKNIEKCNPNVCIGSLICLIVLVGYREFVDAWFKRRLKFPLPVELLLVVLATVASYYTDFFRGKDIVGKLPNSTSVFSVPEYDIFRHVFKDAILIALVTFSISVSMSKIFAKKHDYQIEPNQEWLAYGFASVFSSFFSCHCCSASLSRSAVQDTQGGKTQLASLFGCVVVAFAVFVLSKLFEMLPTGLFLQARQLKPLWKHSKIDFFIWVVTFSAVIISNVTYGLLVGLVFAILTVVFRSQWPDALLLGRIPETDIYKGLDGYSATKEIPGVKIFRFDAPLYFANVDNFKSQLYNTVGIDPYKMKRKKAAIEKANKSSSRGNNGYLQDDEHILAETPMPSPRNKSTDRLKDNISGETPTSINSPCCYNGNDNERVVEIEHSPVDLHHIVIDCSTFPYVDVMGVGTLKQVYEEFADLGITVFFCTCKVAIRYRFQCCDFYETVPKQCLFLTVHDAVIAASTNSNDRGRSDNENVRTY